MTIQPEIRSGVPEEEGWYLADFGSYYNSSKMWLMMYVKKEKVDSDWPVSDPNPPTKLIATSVGSNDWLKEENFEYYTWSERIEEPEL